MKKNPLEAYGIARFLREHWQKKPCVLRGVAPQLAQALSRDDLIDLACRDDVESRLIIGKGKRWQVSNGPFRRNIFAKLPAQCWTLLVNGVETLVPAANALQRDFGFIPYARQDDVMVSYAAPGGGVGPHFDSYDVFLLQGAGTRRWQISAQRDLSLQDGAPLKLLRRFRAERDLLMQSGDLLYLPPDYAHNGTAVGECLTWSIGMRAPRQQEVAARFLDYLQDHLTADGVYRDRGLQPQRHRAEIALPMQRTMRRMLDAVRWDDGDIDRCVGEMLSEPRQHVVFERRRGNGAVTFARQLKARGVRLALKSRMLFDRRAIYINGESVPVTARDAVVLRQLADARTLVPGVKCGNSVRDLLYRWYCAGYIELGAAAPPPR